MKGSKLDAWLAEHVCGWERCTDRWCSAEKGCVAKDVVCGETGGLDPGTRWKVHVPYPKYTSDSGACLDLLEMLVRGSCSVNLEMELRDGRVLHEVTCTLGKPIVTPSEMLKEKRLYSETGHLFEAVPRLAQRVLRDWPRLDWTKCS